MIHTPNQDESQNHAPGNPRDSGFWRDALKGGYFYKLKQFQKLTYGTARNPT
jgi:hypothetical protein